MNNLTDVEDTNEKKLIKYEQMIKQEHIQSEIINTIIDLKIALMDQVKHDGLPLLQYFDIDSWIDIHTRMNT